MFRLERRFVEINDSAEQERVTLQQLSLVALPIAPAVVKRFCIRVPKF
jgi:hypothetical protein